MVIVLFVESFVGRCACARWHRQFLLGIGLTTCLLVPGAAFGQSSLTTELTEERKLDLTFDFLGSIARRDAGGFEWYLPAVAFGVTDRLEVGGALSVITPTTSLEPQEFVPSVRWRWLETKPGQAAVIGGAWHIPTPGRDRASAYGIVDLAFSQRFASEHVATAGVGIYALVDRRNLGETRRGVTLSWVIGGKSNMM